MMPQIEVFSKKKVVTCLAGTNCATSGKLDLIRSNKRLNTKIPDIWDFSKLFSNTDFNAKILDMSRQVWTYGNPKLLAIFLLCFGGI